MVKLAQSSWAIRSKIIFLFFILVSVGGIILLANMELHPMDTDNDTILDYKDTHLTILGRDLIDSDADGLTNWEENHGYHTNPYSNDTDGDYVSDGLEVKKGTDPTNIYSFGQTEIDDFNRIFTYPDYLNSNNSDRDDTFLSRIPHVIAKPPENIEGNMLREFNLFETYTPHIFEIASKDPLVSYYADKTELILPSNNENGKIIVGGENVFSIYNSNALGPINPAYFLTHGRTGICADAATTTYTLVKLKGVDSYMMMGIQPDGDGHSWVEIKLDGNVYEIDFNDVIARDKFYVGNWSAVQIVF